ncbi:hypothetical protein CYMTET_23596 [Cymbomonas tetramitiformis]|uniref:Uncharacterized protein n=1 Tax=Cymbomonas tetramitiformis TaxID=36881 RepID=A0AAE0L0R3_9CHLO|nr:hypothetical protein CYMTET_23596 [Cymbomonas tetramitiformis]
MAAPMRFVTGRSGSLREGGGWQSKSKEKLSEEEYRFNPDPCSSPLASDNYFLINATLRVRLFQELREKCGARGSSAEAPARRSRWGPAPGAPASPHAHQHHPPPPQQQQFQEHLKQQQQYWEQRKQQERKEAQNAQAHSLRALGPSD